MPTLGAALDFAKYEGRNFRGHQLASAPGSPVAGQLYYNTGDNTLYWFNGTIWVSAQGGAGGPPTGTAGGDLSGTYPNPQIATGTIVDADVAAANKDGGTAVPSLRTLGAGAQQAMAGNTPLNVVPLPNGNLSLNNMRITGLADPTLSTDAATRNYVDTFAQGLDAKVSVRCASTANLGLTGLAAIDGITPIAGDRVLVKNQTTPAQNGVYLAASGAWSRVQDMDAWTEVPSAFVFVESGTTQADTGWVCTADPGGTLGTTSITWTQFSGAGEYTWGNGLAATGNVVDVGAGAGISVAADTVAVATGGVTNAMLAGSIDATTKLTGAVPVANGGTGQTTAKLARETGLVSVGYYQNAATHGAGTTIAITQATHGLRGSRAILVQVQDNATGAVEIPDIGVAANGDVTITYGASVTANTKLVTLVG